MQRINEFSQPIGIALPNWKPRSLPQPVTLTGRTCRLEPLNTGEHANDLFAAYRHDDSLWTYMSFGPFQNVGELGKFIEMGMKGPDEYFAIIDLSTSMAVGMIALKRADPMNGVVEGGRAVFSPLLKQSILSTETHYLLMAYVFDQLGYRRYEWSTDNLNKPALKSVTRIGFTLEGVFRSIQVEKGRNQDLAWFSIIDYEWPIIKKTFESWLAPDNFDQQGRQIRKIEDIRKSVARKVSGIPCSL